MKCQKCGLSFWQAFKQGWLQQRKCDDGAPHRFKRSLAADQATRRVDWRGSLALLGVLASMSGTAILLQAGGLEARSALAGILSWTILVWLVGSIFGMTVTIPKSLFRRNRSVEARHE